MSVTLVVPAYNEEKRISRMLADYLQFFGPEVKLFVVLNGCQDQTEAVVKKWQQQYPQRLTYVVYPQTWGKGWAVRQGWSQVQNDWLGVVDADGVTVAEEFAKLIDLCQQDKVDGAIASRYVRGAKVKDRVSVLRRLASHVYRFVVKLLFQLPYKDTQCGAKLFRGQVIKKILPYLEDNSMAFDVEILLVCQRFGYQIAEVPTVWSETEKSTFMTSAWQVGKTSVRMLRSLWWLRFFKKK